MYNFLFKLYLQKGTYSSQMKPVYVQASYFFKILFIIIFSSSPMYSMRFLSYIFPHKNRAGVYLRLLSFCCGIIGYIFIVIYDIMNISLLWRYLIQILFTCVL